MENISVWKNIFKFIFKGTPLITLPHIDENAVNWHFSKYKKCKNQIYFIHVIVLFAIAKLDVISIEKNYYNNL